MPSQTPTISKNVNQAILRRCYNMFLVVLLCYQLPYALAMSIIKTSSWFVKEVIILYVYHLGIFFPYYETSPP